MMGYALQELKQRDFSALGYQSVEEIVTQLFGSCDNVMLKNCSQVYREIGSGADIETLWRLVTQNPVQAE